MGLLDQILGAALGGQGGQKPPGGGLGDLLSGLAGGGRQPGSGANLMATLLPAVLAMLANRSGSASGGGLAGGLDVLLRQFQAAGLSQQANSWIGRGDNLPISADDLKRVLGQEQLAQLAAQAGVPEEQASAGLADLLPEFVNQLTPEGQMPPQGELDNALSGLRRSLGF